MLWIHLSMFICIMHVIFVSHYSQRRLENEYQLHNSVVILKDADRTPCGLFHWNRSTNERRYFDGARNL